MAGCRDGGVRVIWLKSHPWKMKTVVSAGFDCLFKERGYEFVRNTQKQAIRRHREQSPGCQDLGCGTELIVAGFPLGLLGMFWNGTVVTAATHDHCHNRHPTEHFKMVKCYCKWLPW